MLIFNFEDEETNSILANEINTIFVSLAPLKRLELKTRGAQAQIPFLNFY